MGGRRRRAGRRAGRPRCARRGARAPRLVVGRPSSGSGTSLEHARTGPSGAARRRRRRRRPRTTAVTRSKATVAAAVTTSTKASPRLARSERRGRSTTSTIRTRGGDEHAGQRRERDAADDGREQRGRRAAGTSGVDDGGEPRGRAAADVDRGARDRRGGGHAAEQRADQVGHALAEQLPVGVVALATRSSRRRRSPTAGSRARRARRPRAAGTSRSGEVAPRGPPAAAVPGGPTGSAPMRGDVEASDLAQRRWPSTTASSEPGRPGRSRAASSITATTPSVISRRGTSAGRGTRTARAERRGRDDVVAVEPVDAERRRHLLERDDQRDAEREPLDHGQRDEAHVAAERRRRPSPTSTSPASRPTDEHAVGAVAPPRSGSARRSSRRWGR